jgi:ADP-ribose pyrophosphatase
MNKWEILQRKIVFERSVYNIEELYCKHPAKQQEYNFTVMNTPDWVNIVALIEEDTFLMVEQHRLGINEITIETPAGIIESGETPEQAALRELQEETGYSTNNLIPLKSLKANPAIMNTNIHFFAAERCFSVSKQKLDDEEDINIKILNRSELNEKFKNGILNHSIIITAIQLYYASKKTDIFL